MAMITTTPVPPGGIMEAIPTAHAVWTTHTTGEPCERGRKRRGIGSDEMRSSSPASQRRGTKLASHPSRETATADRMGEGEATTATRRAGADRNGYRSCGHPPSRGLRIRTRDRDRDFSTTACPLSVPQSLPPVPPLGVGMRVRARPRQVKWCWVRAPFFSFPFRLPGATGGARGSALLCFSAEIDGEMTRCDAPALAASGSLAGEQRAGSCAPRCRPPPARVRRLAWRLSHEDRDVALCMEYVRAVHPSLPSC